MKKKFLLKIISAVLASVMMSTVTFADTPEETYTVYDDSGNSYTVGDEMVLGVLYDKYGNVKEQVVASPRATYVDGAKYTLDPGDYFITYQYEVFGSFFAGFYYYFKNETSPSTTPGGKLKISLQDSATIGGTRRNVYTKTFDTTYHEGDEDELCEHGLSKTIGISLVSSSRPYYNARFENVGTKTITVCWLVGKD